MVNLFKSAISLMTVFLFGSAGEILTEKSGHLNMGIPGIMALGGLGGVIGECLYINNIPITANPNPFLCVFIPIVFAMIFGGLGGLLFSFFTVSLRCNQNVVGLCLTILGAGITTFFFTSSRFLNFDRLLDAGAYFSSLFYPNVDPTSLNWFQNIFLSHGILTYLAIIVAIVCGFVIKRTKVGLTLRSVGENPAAADSMGISVSKYRYLSTIIGAAIAALGGLYLILDFSQGADPAGVEIEPYGWLAVALVIFSMWRPGFAILGSFVFSVLVVLPEALAFKGATLYVMKMLPYLLTIIVLIITSILKLKNANPPKALGTSYFREDR